MRNPERNPTTSTTNICVLGDANVGKWSLVQALGESRHSGRVLEFIDHVGTSLSFFRQMSNNLTRFIFQRK